MLEQMIKVVIDNKLEIDYPHLKLPAASRARITRVQLGTEYTVYNLKILDKNNVIDERFPEIPGLKSNLVLEINDVVVVLLLYGELDLYIIGKSVS